MDFFVTRATDGHPGLDIVQIRAATNPVLPSVVYVGRGALAYPAKGITVKEIFSQGGILAQFALSFLTNPSKRGFPA